MALDGNLTEAQWQELEGLKALLHPFYISTIKIQKEDLTPGEFLAEWRYLKNFVTSRGGLIAEGIKLSMERRESWLLKNKVFLAAIYVDPKYRILIKDSLHEARSALCEIAIKVKAIDPDNSEESSSEAGSSNNESFEVKSMTDFEKLLDQDEKKEKGDNTGIKNISERDKFRQAFSIVTNEVEKVTRFSGMDVKTAINAYPELIRDTARIITALPPTQVSVERLFSALKLLKSDNRASLDANVLEAMLFLRTNKFISH